MVNCVGCRIKLCVDIVVLVGVEGETRKEQESAKLRGMQILYKRKINIKIAQNICLFL